MRKPVELAGCAAVDHDKIARAISEIERGNECHFAVQSANILELL